MALAGRLSPWHMALSGDTGTGSLSVSPERSSVAGSDHPESDMRRGAVAVLCLLALGAITPAASAQDLLVTHARLIDGTGAPPRDDVDILVRDGRFVSVGAAGAVARPPGVRVLDARGRTVIPGLADMHVHLSRGAPLPRRPDETRVVLARELFYGVTTVLQLGATDGDIASIQRLKAANREGPVVSPWIYGTGGHLTLPGTHPIYTIFPPHLRAEADRLTAATPVDAPVDLVPLGIGLSFVRTELAARTAVDQRAAGGMDAIKVTIESGPMPFGDDHPLMDVPMVSAIVDQARGHQLPVFAHVSSPAELDIAIAGGVDAVVHTVIDRPLPDAGVATRIADAGLHVVPTLTLNDGAVEFLTAPGYMDDPFFRATVSDAEIAALKGDFAGIWVRNWDINAGPDGTDRPAAMRRHRADVLRSVGEMHAAGVPIVVGTDTGNPFVYPGYSVHRELELLVQAGLTPAEAITAATHRAAQMLDAADEFGSIAPGRRADLVILDRDPLADIRNTRSIAEVVARGVVIDRGALPVGGE